jgi:hypothetical protein
MSAGGLGAARVFTLQPPVAHLECAGIIFFQAPDSVPPWAENFARH